MHSIQKNDENIYKDFKLNIFKIFRNWKNRRLQSKQPHQFSEVHPHRGKINSKGGQTIHFPCIYLVGASLKNKSFYMSLNIYQICCLLHCCEDENYKHSYKSQDIYWVDIQWPLHSLQGRKRENTDVKLCTSSSICIRTYQTFRALVW